MARPWRGKWRNKWLAADWHQVKKPSNRTNNDLDVKHEATLSRVVALLSSDVPAVIKLMGGRWAGGC